MLTSFIFPHPHPPPRCHRPSPPQGHSERNRLKSYVRFATLGLGSKVDGDTGGMVPASLLRRMHASCAEAQVDVLGALIAMLDVFIPTYYSIRLPGAIASVRDMIVSATRYTLCLLESSVGLDGVLVTRQTVAEVAEGKGEEKEGRAGAGELGAGRDEGVEEASTSGAAAGASGEAAAAAPGSASGGEAAAAIAGTAVPGAGVAEAAAAAPTAAAQQRREERAASAAAADVGEGSAAAAS